MNATQESSQSKLLVTVLKNARQNCRKLFLKKDESKVEERRRGSTGRVVEVQTLVTRVQLRSLRSLRKTFPQEMGTRKTQEPSSRD